MTCRTLCNPRAGRSRTLVSDADGTKWLLEMDFENGVGEISPSPRLLQPRHRRAPSKIVFRFPRPAQDQRGRA